MMSHADNECFIPGVLYTRMTSQS